MNGLKQAMRRNWFIPIATAAGASIIGDIVGLNPLAAILAGIVAAAVIYFWEDIIDSLRAYLGS